jgi:hypothetical protein
VELEKVPWQAKLDFHQISKTKNLTVFLDSKFLTNIEFEIQLTF